MVQKTEHPTMRPCLNRPKANPKHRPKPETYFGNPPNLYISVRQGDGPYLARRVPTVKV